MVSSAQMLDWVDGRNSSSFGNISYANGALSFSLTTNSKARGLEAMLPARSASGPLSRLTRDGQPVSWNRRTVKGVDYVVFDGTAGEYSATYANDTTRPPCPRSPPRLTARATPPSAGRPTSHRPRWSSTGAPPPSGRRYPRAQRSRTTRSSSAGSRRTRPTASASRSTDTAGNATTSPAVGSAPATLPDAARIARRFPHRRVRGRHAEQHPPGAEPRRARRRGSAEPGVRRRLRIGLTLGRVDEPSLRHRRQDIARRRGGVSG